VVARRELDPDLVHVNLNEPLDERSPLATSAVLTTARTKEALLLTAASLDAQHDNDPYLASKKPQSLLCVPLIRQGQLTGILYLENEVSHDVFTADRIEMLHTLAAQGAIALENAALYERVQAVTERHQIANRELSEANQRLSAVTSELQRSNQELSAANLRLSAVTSELQKSNRELSESNERLQHEGEERARAERERISLQEEIIRSQSQRLAEMSTPLIPISDDIMVMPLVGSMDDQRARQIMDTALSGAQTSRARVVILDITGLKDVNSSVAGALVSTSKALRLLGTQAVLTGIRSDVAQTMVGLGLDLGSMITCSTLQSGINYALNLANEAQLRTDARRTANIPGALPRLRPPSR
jgi:anti-anti-sigma regulatory factor